MPCKLWALLTFQTNSSMKSPHSNCSQVLPSWCSLASLLLTSRNIQTKTSVSSSLTEYFVLRTDLTVTTFTAKITDRQITLLRCGWCQPGGCTEWPVTTLRDAFVLPVAACRMSYVLLRSCDPLLGCADTGGQGTLSVQAPLTTGDFCVTNGNYQEKCWLLSTWLTCTALLYNLRI